MRSLHIDHHIKMILGEVESLRITGVKVNAEHAMRFTIVINSFGILINGNVCFWLVISPDEGGAAAMPTADLKDILVRQFCTARHVVIQLDGGPVGFVLRAKLQRFAFGRPVPVIQKSDGIIADAV